MITAAQVRAAAKARVNDNNLNSVMMALDAQGTRVGLDLPHRAVPYLAQLGHESGDFRYDRELWGPTPAQMRYDTRTDLGNTPAADGDGFKNRGRGSIQLTGGYNIRAFHAWCLENGLSPPDFVGNPDLINTDPWEGLSAIWYWDKGNPDGRSLNRYADRGDLEMVTRKINGGLNGFADRLERYTRLGLVVLGFSPDDIRGFQGAAKAAGKYAGNLDGVDGPQTRAAIHLMLVDLVPAGAEKPAVKAAPVTEERVIEVAVDKPIAVTPPSLNAPWWQSKEVLVPAAGGGLATSLNALGAIPWENLLIFLGFIAIAGGFLYWRKKADAKAVGQRVAGIS